MKIIFRKKPSAKETEEAVLYSALCEAKRQLDTARSCFREALEPDVIDELIYRMQAADKKYSYFLKKIRERFPKEGEGLST